MASVKVKISRVRNLPALPRYFHHGDSGMDLSNSGDEIVLKPFQRALVPTGIKVAIPSGYELQIRPRSGLALREGLTVLNTPGTIDSGYRGEVGVVVYNTDPQKSIHIKTGQRVAQAVLKKIEIIEWEEVNEDELDQTCRKEGGFGSTGAEIKTD